MSERQNVGRNVAAAIFVAVVASSACSVPPSAGPGAAQTSASGAVTTIALSNFGTAVALRPDGTRAFVPLQTGSVLAVDLTSKQVASTIRTEGAPYAIGLTRDGARGYVTDVSGQSLFALDTANGSLVKTIHLESREAPTRTPAVAVSRDGWWVYVTNAGVMDDHLAVIDAGSNKLYGVHGLAGVHPVGVAVSPGGNRVFVAGCKLACVDGDLLTLDAASGSVVSSAHLPAAPVGLALSPDGSHAFMPTGLSGTVQAVNLADGAMTAISVDDEPLGIDVDPRGIFVYVTRYGASKVSVIDARTNAVVATVPVANEPRSIAVSPDGKFAYVTHSSPVLTVIDTQRAGVPAS
jgi:YVTN family beta-propeller protein